uniref:Uncharacterized protein n=1 Tax=Oryza glumipatula TaxID=40148 RepID=A0A0E0BH52_9ORYZ
MEPGHAFQVRQSSGRFPFSPRTPLRSNPAIRRARIPESIFYVRRAASPSRIHLGNLFLVIEQVKPSRQSIECGGRTAVYLLASLKLSQEMSE